MNESLDEARGDFLVHNISLVVKQSGSESHRCGAVGQSVCPSIPFVFGILEVVVGEVVRGLRVLN